MAYGSGYGGGYSRGPDDPWWPTLAVEIAFASIAGDLGYLVLDDTIDGLLDSATLGPADAVVEDVTVKVQRAWVNRGSQRFDGVYARAEAGRAGVTLDNSDREFDPTNLAGPHVAGGSTEIEPMRMFRLRATWNNVPYNLWRGFADEWALDYNMPAVATTELTGTDGTKVLSNFDSVAGATVGGGESTGARINRILDAAGWPVADRDIDIGRTTVQSTDLSSNAWIEILLTSDTEIGEVYFDAANRLVFRNRHAILTEARSITPQGVFGEGAGGLPYDAITISNDDTQVRNIIRISRVGGTLQVAEDSDSIARYQRKTWGRSDLLMETDAEAANYADYVLSLSRNAELRFDSIRIDPTADPDNLWPQVLGRELGDRITIIFCPPGGGDNIERDVFIRGIHHDITSQTWVTSWTLQDASAQFFTQSSLALLLDDASLGKLDTNVLATAY
jgi:hypothetical protein